jgi:hypothetical protein
MTDDELKAIEARADRSTPDLQYGSVIDDDSLQKEDVVFSIAQGRVATLHGGLSLQTCDNGGFFTSARTDVLTLVAEVRRLRAVCDGVSQKLLSTEFDVLVREGYERLPEAVGSLRANRDALVRRMRMT